MKPIGVGFVDKPPVIFLIRSPRRNPHTFTESRPGCMSPGMLTTTLSHYTVKSYFRHWQGFGQPFLFARDVTDLCFTENGVPLSIWSERPGPD